MTSPIDVTLREEDRQSSSTPSSMICCSLPALISVFDFDDDFAGFGVDDVVEGIRALEIGRGNLDLVRSSARRSSAIADLGDLFALANDLFLLVLDVLFGTHADEVRVALGWTVTIKLALFDDHFIGGVEELENLRIRVLGILDDLFEDAVRDGLHVDLRIQPQAECTQEDRSR